MIENFLSSLIEKYVPKWIVERVNTARRSLGLLRDDVEQSSNVGIELGEMWDKASKMPIDWSLEAHVRESEGVTTYHKETDDLLVDVSKSTKLGDKITRIIGSHVSDNGICELSNFMNPEMRLEGACLPHQLDVNGVDAVYLRESGAQVFLKSEISPDLQISYIYKNGHVTEVSVVDTKSGDAANDKTVYINRRGEWLVPSVAKHVESKLSMTDDGRVRIVAGIGEIPSGSIVLPNLDETELLAAGKVELDKITNAMEVNVRMLMPDNQGVIQEVRI